MTENRSLRQVTEGSEMLALAAKIKNNYPHCISTYNTLLMNGRGHNTCFQYEFYVPLNYPDSHIVIWTRKVDKLHMNIYCTEAEISLMAIVSQGEDFLRFAREDQALFYYLPDYLTDPLLEHLQKASEVLITKFFGRTLTYVSQQSYELRCPAGLRVRRLSKVGVHHAMQTSDHAKYESTELYVMLTKNLPALGFYVDETASEETTINIEKLEFAGPKEIPVSWISMYHFGPFGMLMTDESYRRRGLAGVLVEMMGRLLLADGYFPHAHVEPHNETSLRMFRKLPGWNDSHTSIWLEKNCSKN